MLLPRMHRYIMLHNLLRLDQTFHLYFMMIIVQRYVLKWQKEKIANRKERKKGERKDVDTTNSEKQITKETKCRSYKMAKIF